MTHIVLPVTLSMARPSELKHTVRTRAVRIHVPFARSVWVSKCSVPFWAWRIFARFVNVPNSTWMRYTASCCVYKLHTDTARTHIFHNKQTREEHDPDCSMQMSWTASRIINSANDLQHLNVQTCYILERFEFWSVPNRSHRSFQNSAERANAEKCYESQLYNTNIWSSRPSWCTI